MLCSSVTYIGLGISAVVGRSPLVPTDTAVLCPMDFALLSPRDLALTCSTDFALACARDLELPVWRPCPGRLVGDAPEEWNSGGAATPSVLMLPLDPMLRRCRNCAEMEGGLEGLSHPTSGS